MPAHFTLTEAARQLGISRRRLYDWMEESMMIAGSASEDGRVKTLTRAQVERLARDHKKTLREPADLAAVFARLEALERHFTALEGRISSLLESPPSRASYTHTEAVSTHAPLPPASPSPASPSAEGVVPPPVRMLVAAWVSEHGGPSKDTVRRWHDLPLDPAEALRFTQRKIAELGYRAHGAQLHRCGKSGCVCQEVLT